MKLGPFLSSVRLRLTLWNVLVLALVLIVSGVLLRQLVQKSLIDGVDEELSHNNRRIAEHWPPKDRTHRWDHPRTDVLHTRILNLEGTDYFNHANEVLLGPGSFRIAVHSSESVSETIMLGIPSEPVRMLFSPLRDHEVGPITAVAVQLQSLTPVEQEVNLLTRKLLTLIPISLLIAGAGAAFLTDRALRPVRAVTRAASRIEAAQHLSARLFVKGNDEFSQLANTFNGMVARLEEAFMQLERAYDEQRRFVADASHELRTPLTIIKANTSLALSDPDLDSAYRDVLVEVDRAADRTSRIVQDLFLLARSDNGQMPMERDVVDLYELLHQVCDESRYFAGVTPAAPAARVELSLSNASPLLVDGDYNHLLRLFSNLIDNALRHTPCTGTISVSAATVSLPKGIVLITVADTGEGIPREHLTRICERFFRADKARSRADGGTGLGLAICTAIVQAHGGTMTFESEVSVGTKVFVSLPASVIVPLTQTQSKRADVNRALARI